MDILRSRGNVDATTRGCVTESGDDRSKQLLVMPTESLLTNGEWLPGELLGGSERVHRTPGWFLVVLYDLIVNLSTDCLSLLIKL